MQEWNGCGGQGVNPLFCPFKQWLPRPIQPLERSSIIMVGRLSFSCLPVVWLRMIVFSFSLLLLLLYIACVCLGIRNYRSMLNSLLSSLCRISLRRSNSPRDCLNWVAGIYILRRDVGTWPLRLGLTSISNDRTDEEEHNTAPGHMPIQVYLQLNLPRQRHNRVNNTFSR